MAGIRSGKRKQICGIQSQMSQTWNYKLKASACTAVAIGVGIAALLWVWWDSYALLGALLGVVVGWAVGILLAPYDEEIKKFRGWSKALTGFIGGITLTKLEQAFSNMSQEVEGGTNGRDRPTPAYCREHLLFLNRHSCLRV